MPYVDLIKAAFRPYMSRNPTVYSNLLDGQIKLKPLQVISDED